MADKDTVSQPVSSVRGDPEEADTDRAHTAGENTNGANDEIQITRPPQPSNVREQYKPKHESSKLRGGAESHEESAEKASSPYGGHGAKEEMPCKNFMNEIEVSAAKPYEAGNTETANAMSELYVKTYTKNASVENGTRRVEKSSTSKVKGLDSKAESYIECQFGDEINDASNETLSVSLTESSEAPLVAKRHDSKSTKGIPDQYLQLISEDSKQTAQTTRMLPRLPKFQSRHGPMSKPYTRLESIEDFYTRRKYDVSDFVFDIEDKDKQTSSSASYKHHEMQLQYKDASPDYWPIRKSNSYHVIIPREQISDCSPRAATSQLTLHISPVRYEPTPSVILDEISVDGSHLSDSDDNDLDDDIMDIQAADDLGSTDTDTGCVDEKSKKKKKKILTQKITIRRPTNDHIVEKMAQVPPVMIYYAQMQKEFRWHRLFFNHREVVDFCVFEFGRRREYLMWRTLCLLLVASIHLLTHAMKPSALIPFPAAGDVRVGSELSIHTWLGWLLLGQLVVELFMLMVYWFMYPTCYLSRFHTTPFLWNIVWFLNNIVTPNLLSCAFMHGFVFTKEDSYPGSLGSNVRIALASLCLIHTFVGATPVRIAHCFQPLLLTLAFIVYVNVAHPCSNVASVVDVSEVQEDQALHLIKVAKCYLNPIMWSSGSSCCFVFSSIWLAATMCAHLALVYISWCRRIVFRGYRERSVPVYGQYPKSHQYSEHESEVSPQMVRQCEQDGFKAEKFIPGMKLSPPYTRTTRFRKSAVSETEIT